MGNADFVRPKKSKIFNFVWFSRMFRANQISFLDGTIDYGDNGENPLVSIVPAIKQKCAKGLRYIAVGRWRDPLHNCLKH